MAVYLFLYPKYASEVINNSELFTSREMFLFLNIS